MKKKYCFKENNCLINEWESPVGLVADTSFPVNSNLSSFFPECTSPDSDADFWGVGGGLLFSTIIFLPLWSFQSYSSCRKQVCRVVARPHHRAGVGHLFLWAHKSSSGEFREKSALMLMTSLLGPSAALCRTGTLRTKKGWDACCFLEGTIKRGTRGDIYPYNWASI